MSNTTNNGLQTADGTIVTGPPTGPKAMDNQTTTDSALSSEIKSDEISTGTVSSQPASE